MKEHWAECKDCGWTDKWKEVKKVSTTNGKQFVDTLYCPQCDKEGVTFLIKEIDNQ